MKKVLVAAMAVGLGLGVSATALASIGSEAVRGQQGSLPGMPGGGDDEAVSSVDDKPIFYAAEAFSKNNPYTIPKWTIGTTARFSTEDEENGLTGLTIKATLQEGCTLSGTPTLANGDAEGDYHSTPVVEIHVVTDDDDPPEFGWVEIPATLYGSGDNGIAIMLDEEAFKAALEEAATNLQTGGPDNDSIIGGLDTHWNVAVKAVINNFSFNDKNEVLAEHNGTVSATLEFTASGKDVKGADSGSAVIAVAKTNYGTSTITPYGVTVDGKYSLTTFVPDSNGTTADTAANARLNLGPESSFDSRKFTNSIGNTYSGTLMTQNGTIPFEDQALDVTFEMWQKGGVFDPAIGDIWIDLNSSGTKDANEVLEVETDEAGKQVASITFQTVDKETGKAIKTPKIYVDSDAEVTDEFALRLPYSAEFLGKLSLAAEGKELPTSGDSAGVWGFNGSMLQATRFDIGGTGGKCTITLTNTTNDDVEYLSFFYPAPDAKGVMPDLKDPKKFEYGTKKDGVVPANSALHIPCQDIVKKVASNTGALEVLTMGNLTGAYGTIKGSSANVETMLKK